MPEIKRTFNVGKMNRDIDDRMVPPGEFREGFNINIGQSEGSDVGAVENLLGNELVAQCGLSGNPVCIGSLRDNGSEKIYFFVTTNSIYNETNTGSHGIYEYDQKSKQTTALLISTQLNFHTSFPVSGINVVDDLLFFTDNRNAPRKINVVTARNNVSYYTSTPSIDNLISVCKFAPYESPTLVSAVNDPTISSTFLQLKLVRFSYRWQFEDNEYSTLAPFTPICFSRLNETDTISAALGNFGEIETFINAINKVQLQIPTPQGYGISNVELIYKESGSSALYVVEDIEVTTEPFINFTYSSTDPFRTLPGDQLTRVYDAVPRKAKSQEIGGGRLVYGNFLQNFDIPQIAFSVARTGENSARNTILSNQSVKSRRTYQVGIVLADQFGRQSPVILSSAGEDAVFVNSSTGNASSTTAFNALRITFTDVTQIPTWAYSYRVVVKQREQEYYNWISIVSALNTVERLGDSINKIPRDQTAVIPPSTSATISPCNVSVYPKYLNGGNVYTPQGTNPPVVKPQANLTKVQSIGNPSGDALVTTLDQAGNAVSSGLCVFETEPVDSDLDIFYETSTGGLVSEIPASAIDINFFNCILMTFDPGGSGDDHIEINRIKAGFNEPFFDIGVRAFVVQENFTEERRDNTLIHSSGLLNSRTGINYINQFNESEGGLTMSLDPLNGSIQKLFADDTQIVVFQQDKVSRSPIDKDFIYSAEGGAVPVTSNTQFLGTIAAYAGQYGIADNPESFASFGFSRYFTDKNRGAVLRLSQNGIQEISQAGMGDFFRDALKTSTKIIGSFDEYSRIYELTIIGEGYDSNQDTNLATASSGFLTVSFDDRSNGWTSFRSFKQESGLSLNNSYYTFKGGDLWQHHSPNVTSNNFYGAGTVESYVIPVFNDAPSNVKQFNSLSYEGDSGWELEYIETDIDTAGTVPIEAVSFTTTLQLSGAAANSTFTGSNTSIAKQGVGIQWAIFVSPLNSQFEFTNINNITLTQASGSSLTVTNPVGTKPFESTDGRLVFLVQHTVGNQNSIQTLNIGGTGAELAFTVALLTVNIVDTVSNSAITPASLIFNNAGSNNIVFSTAVVDNYYIDASNTTLSTSGMPASTNPQAATVARSAPFLNNLTYTLPITVPTSATAGSITLNGFATRKWQLIFDVGNALSIVDAAGTVSFVMPVQANGDTTSTGNPFFNGPYDVASTRTTVLTYTCSNSQVLTSNSYTASMASDGVTPSVSGNILASSNFGTLIITTIVPILTSDTTITPTITKVAPETAVISALSTPISLPKAGTSTNIANAWNVDVTANPDVDWLIINGGDPGSTQELGPTVGFTIAATDNNTGSIRTGNVVVAVNNNRVQSSMTPSFRTIVINQQIT